MKALFVELPAFARFRAEYFDDEGLRGLRKRRYGDARRGKGKRGGLRVIYYWRPGNEKEEPVCRDFGRLRRLGR